MRHVWTIPLLLLPAACSLAPGQLDLTKINAVNSCVQLTFQGSPAGGTATTTTMLPKPPIGGLGLGALATDTAPVAPTVTQTCTVNATTTDSHDASTTPQ